MTMDAAVPGKIDLSSLPNLGLEELRTLWSARFGQPPKLRSPELLGLMLAWRIQASQLGGVDVEMRRAMRRTSAAPPLTALTPGSRLSREWKGKAHTVVVEADGGLRYDDRLFQSLSQVAREITGSRWNGPRFFGLRSEAAA